jgi:integrase
LTLGKYLERWLELRAVSKAPGTVRDYGYTAIKFQALHDVRLVKLTSDMLQDQFADFAAAGVAPSTMAKYKTHISAALHEAVERGLLASNPMRLVKLASSVGSSRGSQHFISEPEATAMLALDIPEHERRWLPLWQFLLATGLRNGELRGLRWSDVHTDRKMLHIQRSLSEIGEQVSLTKSRRDRIIGLSDDALDALSRQRTQQASESTRASWRNPDGYVFTRRWTGRPYTAQEIRAHWRTITSAAHITARVHDARHTTLSWMLRRGVPLIVVSRWAGHASIKVTADVYGHVEESSMADAATALNGTLQTPKRAISGPSDADTL